MCIRQYYSFGPPGLADFGSLDTIGQFSDLHRGQFRIVGVECMNWPPLCLGWRQRMEDLTVEQLSFAVATLENLVNARGLAHSNWSTSRESNSRKFQRF